jgi:hypothetical protein
MTVGYLFGKFDPETRTTYPFGWKCYNEDCERTVSNSFVMLNEMKPFMEYSGLAAKEVDFDTTENVSTTIDDSVITPLSQPGQMIDLQDIYPGSALYPAIEYLLSRGLDLHKLTADYMVQVIAKSYRYKLINRRIYIPFMRKGSLIGWQAREVPVWDQSGMKYFTSPNGLGGLLYGLGTAVQQRVACTVEGVFDRFAVGDSSFALLTKSFRSSQIARLTQMSNNSQTELFVILLDPLRSMSDCLSGKPHHIDVARDVLQTAFGRLTRSTRVVALTIPDGHDPASFGAKYGKAGLADFLEQHLRKSGYAEFGQILAGNVLSSSALR